MKGLFKINEDSAFGPGMMFGIPGPGPKADSPKIPSDKKKEKGINIKPMKKSIDTSFKKFNEFNTFVEDPFKLGNHVWIKSLKIGDIAVVNVVASIEGFDETHTAMISVITKSMDKGGEELASEKLILHQKDFNSIEDATKHLKEKEKETIFK
jgi:hypothetical protein